MQSIGFARGTVLAVAIWFGGCLPAAAQEAASQTEPVAVAARELPRGAIIEAEDFVLNGATGAENAGPIGWMTRRIIKEGEPLRAPAIAPADVVRSGDAVQLVWSDGSLELRLAGRAMGSAAIGETVQVRVDTQRRYQGTVLEAGIVRLDKPESSRDR